MSGKHRASVSVRASASASVSASVNYRAILIGAHIKSAHDHPLVVAIALIDTSPIYTAHGGHHSDVVRRLERLVDCDEVARPEALGR